MGDFYAFHNLPSSKFAPQERPRYAAFRVLEVTDRLITVVTLDGTFDHSPLLSEVLALPPLRYQNPGVRRDVAVSFVPLDWPPSPNLEFRWLGNTALGADLLALVPELKGYGPWEKVSWDAEGEYRLRHDRERYLEENARRHAEIVAEAKAVEERYQTRQKGLTWDRLLSERHFERWKESPPFPPQAFADAARATIERTIRTIAALGPKPRKPAVRTALRECVEWFNVEAERAGDVIETEERDDILLLLADICFVARQRSLVEEIEQWRTW